MGGLLKASYDDRTNPRRPASPAPQSFDFATHVEKGEAGEAFQRLFPEAHAKYLERAAQGDPDVRPAGVDVYEYLFKSSTPQP